MTFTNAKTLVNRGIKRARDFLADPQNRTNALRAAKVLKYAHDYTKTKHKKKKHKVIHKDTAGKVMVTETFVKGSKMTPHLRKKYADGYKFDYQYVTTWSSATGAGVGVDTSKYKITDIQLAFDGSAITGTLIPMAFQQNTTAQGLAPTAAQNSSVSCLLTRLKYSLEFVNMAPSVTFCTIYLVKAKDDTGSSANVPSNAWEAGVDADAGVVVVGGGAANVKSTWPFGSPKPNQTFRDAWTIIHQEEIDMDPGETRRHVMNVQVNKERNYTDFVQNSAYVKGITHYLFIAARGAPGDTLNTPSVGTIMFCPHKLIGVLGVEQYGVVQIKQSKVLNQYNNISTAGATNLYTMNDDKGSADNVNTVNYG